MIGTQQLRKAKIMNDAKITVDGKEINETSSEKLLGVVVNNTLTWNNHLYGDTENEGLIQQLSRRLGMLKMMSKHMERNNLNFFASGMFYSKLCYCLPVFGNVMGLEEFKENNSRYQSYTVKDNNKLQVLQNKLNRLLLNARFDTPTEVLLRETSSLSIQQMIAYHTTLLARKILTSGKPHHLKERLVERNDGMHLRKSHGRVIQRNSKLSIYKEGFIHRSTCLLNKLSEEVRNEEMLEKFKVQLRKWVIMNIPIKPITRYPKFEARIVTRPTVPDQRDRQQDIRSFFVDRSTYASSVEERPAVPPNPTDRPPPAVREGILRYFRPILAFEQHTENEDNVNGDV